MTDAIDLSTANEFIARHIGPRDADVASMLELLGYASLEALIDSVIPESIKGSSVLEMTAGLSEADALAKIKAGDFRTSETTGKSDQQHRPVAQATQ